MPTGASPIFINRSGINYRSRDHLSLVSANARQHRKDLARTTAGKHTGQPASSKESLEPIVSDNQDNQNENTEESRKRQGTADTKLALRAIRPKSVRQTGSSRKSVPPSANKRNTALKIQQNESACTQCFVTSGDNDEDLKLPEKQELSLLPPTPSSACLIGTLDPFMTLAGKNDMDERTSIQHYLARTAPRIYFGHSRSETFVKAILVGASTNHLFLQWILIVSKASELALQGKSFKNAIASRQSYGYSLIRKALTDEKLRHSQDTLVALASASLVDSRVSGFPVGKSHVTALRHLFYEQPEGWHTIDHLPHISKMTVNMAFVTLPQGSSAFPNHAILDQVLSTFSRLVNAMSDWFSCLRLTSKNNDMDPCQNSNFETYKTTRRRLLSVANAPLSSLGKSCYHISVHEERSRTATVISFVLILWYLRADHEAGAWFLDTLHKTLQEREMVDPQKLNHILLAGIMEDCLHPHRQTAKRQSTDMDKLNPESDLGEACLRISFLLDVLELLEMVPIELRNYFLDLFVDWLVRDLEDPTCMEQADLPVKLNLLEAIVRQEYANHAALDPG